MYKLTPLIDPEINHLLKKKKLIFKLVADFGSPLNLIFPKNMTKNLTKINSVFYTNKVPGKIFFAHKATRSFSLVKMARKLGIGIDVSSLQELKNALDAGFSKENIIANGPKNQGFLVELLKNSITVAIDSIFELKKITQLQKSKKFNTPAEIIFRISSQDKIEKTKYFKRIDKFGLDQKEYEEGISILKKNNLLYLKGLSFHLFSDNFKELFLMTEDALKKIFFLKQIGFAPKVIDIGGGWKTNSLVSKKDWDNFTEIFKKFIATEYENLSFSGEKYGFFIQNNKIKGNFSFQAPYTQETGEKIVNRLLNEKIEFFDNMTIKKIISEFDLELWVEPGKYLLDQCGVTLMKVLGVKNRREERIIFLEGNFTNLWADRFELFTDPLVIKKNSKKKPKKFGYFISGNLCSWVDNIVNHKVFLDEVEPGDILAFINTAAYRMDFICAQPISNPLPKKIVFTNSDKYYLE